jgi:dihydroflavonol-4-reductase
MSPFWVAVFAARAGGDVMCETRWEVGLTGDTKLVIGASGFLGSRVARQLVGDGQRVRALIRATSSTRGIDDLDVEVRRGDIFDEASVRDAMTGCDDVYAS